MSRTLGPATKDELYISSETSNRWFHITVLHFSDVQELTTCHKRWTVFQQRDEHSMAQSDHSRIPHSHITLESQPLARPITDTGTSEKSPIHLLQAGRRITALQPNHSRTTATSQLHYTQNKAEPQPHHCRITTESQPHAYQSQKELCFTARRAFDGFAGSQPNPTQPHHTRFTAAWSPHHSYRNLWDIADPLASSGLQNHSTAAEPHHSRIAPETKPNHSHIIAASQPNHSHMTGTREPNPLVSNSESSPIHVLQALIQLRSVCFRNTAESQPITATSEPDHSLWEIADPLVSSSDDSRIPIKPESEPLRVRQSACFMLWEFIDPLVSSSEKSRMHLFQTLRNRQSACVHLWDIGDRSYFSNSFFTNRNIHWN